MSGYGPAVALVAGWSCACSCPPPPPAPPPAPSARVEAAPPSCPKVNPWYDQTAIRATEDELQSGHLRITYRGPQKSIIETVALRSSKEPEMRNDMWIFFRTPLQEIQNDHWIWSGHEIPVSAAELKRMVDGAAGIVTRKGVSSGGERISLAVVVRRGGQPAGGEFVLGSFAAESGIELYQRLIDALDPSSTLARDALRCQRLRVGWGQATDAPSCERAKGP